MAYTLEKDGTVITLSPDLLWENEFAWSPVSQATERSITGALLVDICARSAAGRPIVLSGTERHAWLSRSEVKAIEAWRALVGQVFTLSIHGETYSVLFDHGTDETSRAFAVTPLVDYSDPQDHHNYRNVTFRFITAP